MKARTKAVLSPALCIVLLVAGLLLGAFAVRGLEYLRQLVLDEESRQMIEQMNR